MFNSNNEEKKLDWMYKGPNSLVNREDYLLGRSVDKTLEQINEEEKQKQLGIAVPKNRVEHECIPPSIRDFNKIVQAEQVDLSTKLQEDPLVVIKKREEECRRQFLQNPVQLKKLQKALKAQQEKKNKKKKHKNKNSRKSENNSDLDTILIHKFNMFKDKLSDDDLKEIFALENKTDNITDIEEDSDLDMKLLEKLKTMKNKQNKINDKTKEKEENKNKKHSSNSESNKSSCSEKGYVKVSHKKSKKRKSRSRSPKLKKSESNSRKKSKKSSSDSESSSESDTDDSSDSYKKKNKNKNWGLVRSDGSKIALQKTDSSTSQRKDVKQVTKIEEKPIYKREKKVHLTEEEKEQKRREMMKDAIDRDKERYHNYRRHKENEKKEQNQMKEFDTEFAHKQYIKSVNSSSVESRIKANANKNQRSSRDMNTHFSRR